jgi:hypothetical protein
MGLRISGALNVLAHHNIFYANYGTQGRNLLRTLHIHKQTVRYITVVHNTLHDNGHANSTGVGQFHSNKDDTVDIEDVIYLNNILSDSINAFDVRHEDMAASYEADYNCYYNSLRALNFHWNGSNYTFANYKTASGEDANSVTGDPDFTDPDNADFSLGGSSSCDDQGRDLTTTTSASTGTTIPVVDSGFFTDGMNCGATGYKATGSVIKIGTNDPVTITGISGNNITVDTSITWGNGDAVNFEYAGTGPNIGAE